MSDVLDYAEKAGHENLRFRLSNAETLAKEASTTLTILLAGTGAALAFAIARMEQGSWTAMASGAAGAATWLVITAAILVWFCIRTTELQAPTNEPLNLYQPDYGLESIRQVELRNLARRIELMTARNRRVALWLDRVRLMAVATPLVFAVSAGAWAGLLWLGLDAPAPAAG